MAHALLSLSASKTWLTCTRMPRFTQGLPDRESPAAAEGTLAHAIAEWTLRGLLGMNSQKFVKAKLAELKSDSRYDTEMSKHVARFVSFVMEKYAEALAIDPNARIFLETVVRLDKYIPEGFGTADVIIVAMGKMIGIDLKYGKGVKVEAEGNTQLKLYALGAAIIFDEQFKFDWFEMWIYQPRLDNIEMMEVDRQSLIDWATYFVKPKARLAWEGKGEFVTGDHCRFCKALAICPAAKEKVMALARFKFAANEHLPDEAVVEAYLIAELLSSWVAETKRYALEKALDGKKWPGLMLVNGRAQRRYRDPDKIAQRLRGMRYEEDDFYKKSLVGIGEMEKLLGADFEKIADLVEKPPGSPTLVKESAGRKPYSKIDGKFKNIS